MNYQIKVKPLFYTEKNQPTTSTIQLETELYVSPLKERNIERLGEYSNMCECCGKRIKEGETKMVHMNTNWNAMHNSIITEQDAIINGFESQGYFYIGNSCAKKMPKEFIHNNTTNQNQRL